MRKPNLGILLKPAGFDCNMACDYCYYRPVQELYPGADNPRMSPEVFEAVCEQYRALEPAEMKIGWQGGEPTLMGLDFFREAVRIEARHARGAEPWGNSLQTNGALLDEDWSRFLADNRFLVGLSIDGPAELNTMRKFRNGKPAFDTAMRALDLLKSGHVEYNILVVISRANVEHPEEVLQFLLEHDCRFAQFIPCTEPAGEAGAVSEHSISPGQYAEFIIRLFDAWVELDDPSFYIRRVDNYLHMFLGLPPECCEYRQDCSNLLTVEWNGDVYPCDFYVQERYRLGNVREQTLSQMLRGRAFRDFVSRAERLPDVCRDCEWLSFCHAGCFRHREKLGIGVQEMPYLCEAKKRIFSHVTPTLEELKARPDKAPRLHSFLNRLAGRIDAQRRQPGPARTASPAPRARAQPPGHPIGRNDPCPCGSGKKYKHCCGRKALVS